MSSSAQKCWEMISHRVFEELATKLNPGRQDLPPLQPDTECINGLGMFGLLSPPIVQVYLYYVAVCMILLFQVCDLLALV